MGNTEYPLVGKLYDGNNCTYKLKKGLGHGGNGTVYSVEILGDDKKLPFSQNGYAIKVFSANKAKEKRKSRFVTEIETVQKLQIRIKGIVPIYDSSSSESYGSDPWYLMPKAYVYKFSERSDLENLKQLLCVGMTISKLHALGYAHRDIKPDNILFFDGKTCLSDYGLVWDESATKHVTSTGETIGPYYIRPPEFEKMHEIDGSMEMYRSSDVYLFAKTLWIFLAKKGYGFRGEYLRLNRTVALNRTELNLGQTVEPLHMLLEGATKNDYNERISIDDCISMINIQISIAENKCPAATLKQYMFDERLKTAKFTVNPDDLIYRDSSSILSVVEQFSGAADVLIDIGFRTKLLGRIDEISAYDKDLFKMIIRNDIGRFSVFFSADRLVISNNGKCKCRVKRIPDIVISSVTRINDISELGFLIDRSFILDMNVELNIQCQSVL